MRAPLATIVAFLSGLLVIAGMIIRPLMDGILVVMLQLAIILAGAALLVGVVNLVKVHLSRVRTRGKLSAYSFVTLAAFLLTLLAGILLGPNTVIFNRVVTEIQYPIESSLMGLAAVSLAFSSLTLINRKRRRPFFIFFLASGLFFLLILVGALDLIDLPAVRWMVAIIEQIPTGGVRGLLVGIALGSLLTGLRVLFGAERPYEG